MLSKTLQISFRLAMYVAFIIGSFKLADNFLYYRSTENQALLASQPFYLNIPFWSIVVYTGIVVFLYMIYMKLSGLFRNFSNKEYFTKPTIKTLKNIGIYALFFQAALIIYMVLFDQPRESVTINSLPPVMASIFYYVELVFTYGTFLLLGLGLIAFSKALERGRWLEHHDSMVH